MNSLRCDVCNFDVHRASYVKHLKSKKHLENEKQNGMIIPDWFFQGLIEIKIKKIYNPKRIKQIARDDVKLDDEHLNKQLAKKMLDR